MKRATLDVRPPKIWKLQKWKKLRKSGQSANEKKSSLQKESSFAGDCLGLSILAFWEPIPIISIAVAVEIWWFENNFKTFGLRMFRIFFLQGWTYIVPLISDGLLGAHHGHLIQPSRAPSRAVFQQVRKWHEDFSLRLCSVWSKGCRMTGLFQKKQPF